METDAADMWRGSTSKCKLAGVFNTRMNQPVCCVEPNGTPVLLIAELPDGGGVVYRKGIKVEIDKSSLAVLHRGSAFDVEPKPEPEPKAKRPHERIEGHLRYWIRQNPKALWNLATELGVDRAIADEVWRDLMKAEPPQLEAATSRVPPTEAVEQHREQLADRAEQHRQRITRRQSEKARREKLEAAIDEQLQLAWQRGGAQPEPALQAEPPQPQAVAVDQLQHRRAELDQIYRLLGWKAA